MSVVCRDVFTLDEVLSSSYVQLFIQHYSLSQITPLLIGASTTMRAEKTICVLQISIKRRKRYKVHILSQFMTAFSCIRNGIETRMRLYFRVDQIAKLHFPRWFE